MYKPIFISVIIAAIRIVGITHPAFQALAHLWLGVLLGAISIGGEQQKSYKLWRTLVIGLSVIEIIMFFITRVL